MLTIITTYSHLIVAWCFGFIFAVLAVINILAKTKRIRAKAELRRQARAYQKRIDELEKQCASEIANLREQLRFDRERVRPHNAVANATIHKTPILNKSEFRLYESLNTYANSLSNGERLFVQVSLVEVFSARAMNGCKDARRAAFEAYGNMRCDFLIVDRSGYPICGIEYQGTGHHQGNFAYREQIKREVFRKAGVPLVEIGSDDPWQESHDRIRAAIRAPLLAA